MRIYLLGPLTMQIGNVPVTPTAARPRQVLALLALNNDKVVSQAVLCEELWGDEPPATATTVHTYIHQIRRLIGPALSDGSGLTSRDVLATEPGGYSLHLHGGDTDVLEFRRLSQMGTIAFENGDFGGASQLLGQALGLWRAPVLPDIRAGVHLALEQLLLEGARLAALDRRIEADLRLGRHLEIVPELGALTIREPFNENFAAYYMSALYQSGQTSKALGEYHRIRADLIRELSVEPSPRIQRIQNAILAGGPAMAASWDGHSAA